MKNWKKWMSLLFAMCLALLPLNGFAAPGDAAILRRDDSRLTDYVENMCAMGDKLCLMGSEALYLYGAGDAEPEAYPWTFGDDELAQEMRDAGSGIAVVDGARILLLRHVMDERSGQYGYAYTVMGDVTLQDGTAVVSNLQKVTWPEELLSYSDGASYPKSCGGSFAMNGVLYMQVYGDRGSEAYSLEIATMKCGSIPFEEPMTIAPCVDGKVLAACSANEGAYLAAYDPASGRTEKLCAPIKDVYSLSGLACDLDTGECYCVNNGQVCAIDLQAGALGEGIVSMPLTGEDQSGCVFAGGYYAYRSYQATVIRNLKSDAAPTQTLKVYDSMWMNSVTSATLDFMNSHGDTSVTVTHDYTEQEQLLQNMMNQDSSVDIYILPTTSSEYAAMHGRNYMPEIASEKLKSLAAQMYPAIQEKILRDGVLTEFPLNAFSWRLGVDERVLEQLGMKLEDLPTNWSDFLDFLNTLPSIMEGKDIAVFEDYFDQQMLRDQLFFMLIADYQSYAERTMDVPAFDTPQLRTLLEKLDNVNFESLGYPAKEPSGDDEALHGSYSMVSMGGMGGGTLFNSSAGASFGTFSSNVTPLLLGIDENDEVPLDLSVTVAFVNPHSKNIALATEFLEQIVENMPEEDLYNFMPTLNEPVKGRYYDEGLKKYQEVYASFQKKYDEADEADRQALLPEMEAVKEELDNYSVNGMAINQAQLDWFRSHDDCVTVRGEDWLFNESTGEAYDLMQQYLSKKISVDELLSGIDGKVQMMIMEGR